MSYYITTQCLYREGEISILSVFELVKIPADVHVHPVYREQLEGQDYAWRETQYSHWEDNEGVLFHYNQTIWHSVYEYDHLGVRNHMEEFRYNKRLIEKYEKALEAIVMTEDCPEIATAEDSHAMADIAREALGWPHD
jgi:hypothetical protein